MTVILLAVRVEAKEDETIEGVPPRTATPAELASYANDLLGDRTKHDAQLGWRVLSVEASDAEA